MQVDTEVDPPKKKNKKNRTVVNKSCKKTKYPTVKIVYPSYSETDIFYKKQTKKLFSK